MTAYPRVISASQHSTWTLCRRKWWLGSVAKVVKVDKGYFDFGVVLHAVVERWMRADEHGVDPSTGQPVELYPVGWEAVGDSGAALTIPEQSLIRRLVETAIGNGTLRRLPGRVPESNIKQVIATAPDGRPIELWGKIDVEVLDPPLVEDHKTGKSKRYLLSPESLARDPQMLLYAKVLLMRREAAGLPPVDRVELRHNQFSKDPDNPFVQHTTAWAEVPAIEEAWGSFLHDAIEVQKDRAWMAWHEVPAPEVGSNACRQYGGCDFLPICRGEQSPETYNRLTTSANADRLRNRSPDTTKERKDMGKLAEMMAARMAGKTGAAPAAPVAEPPMNSGQAPQAPQAPPTPAAAAVAAPAAAEPAATQGPAPWYFDGCAACSKNPIPGISSAGAPCRICDHKQSAAGGPRSVDYVLEYDAARHVNAWRLKGEAAPAVEAPVKGSTVPVSTKAAVAPKAAVKATVAPPPDPDEIDPPGGKSDPEEDFDSPDGEGLEAQPGTTEAEQINIDDTKRKPGRPKEGPILSFVPVRGFKRVVYLSQIVGALVDSISAQKTNWDGEDAQVYFQQNPFKRRDLVAANAETIIAEAEKDGPSVIVVDIDARGPEWSLLIDRLAMICRRQFGTRA